MVFNKDFRGPASPVTSVFAAAAELLLVPSSPSARSRTCRACSTWAQPDVASGYRSTGDEAAVDALEKDGASPPRPQGHGPGLGRAVANRKIKVALVIGEDPLGSAAIPEESRTASSRLTTLSPTCS